MPVFTVLSRVDAFVDYVADVEADTPEQAALYAYYDGRGLKWEHRGTVEFDATHTVTLDVEGDEIESTAHGKL